MPEIPEPVTEYLKQIGAKGGAKSKRTLTPEQIQAMTKARMNSPAALERAAKRQKRLEAKMAEKAARKAAREAKKAARLAEQLAIRQAKADDRAAKRAVKAQAKIDAKIARLQKQYGKVLLRKDALSATLAKIESKITELKNK